MVSRHLPRDSSSMTCSTTAARKLRDRGCTSPTSSPTSTYHRSIQFNQHNSWGASLQNFIECILWKMIKRGYCLWWGLSDNVHPHSSLWGLSSNIFLKFKVTAIILTQLAWKMNYFHQSTLYCNMSLKYLMHCFPSTQLQSQESIRQPEHEHEDWWHINNSKTKRERDVLSGVFSAVAILPRSHGYLHRIPNEHSRQSVWRKSRHSTVVHYLANGVFGLFHRSHAASWISAV